MIPPPTDPKWYIWRSTRSDGGHEWMLQFPERCRGWWTYSLLGPIRIAHDSFEEARDLMLRVEADLDERGFIAALLFQNLWIAAPLLVVAFALCWWFG